MFSTLNLLTFVSKRNRNLKKTDLLIRIVSKVGCSFLTREGKVFALMMQNSNFRVSRKEEAVMGSECITTVALKWCGQSTI